jgi:hypothetical protein
MPLPALIPLIMGAAPLVGKLLGGASQGQASERTNQNDFQQRQNQLELSRYGTQQNALLQALLSQDRGRMDRYGTRQSATTNAMQGQQAATTNALNAQSAEGLNRAQLGLQAPSVRARQSILGSMMKNLQPLSLGTNASTAGRKPSITGGMSAATLDPTTRQHGDELLKAALMAQMTGSDIPAATDFKGGVLDWKGSVLDAPEEIDYTKGLITPPELAGYKQPGKWESRLSLASIILNLLGEIPTGGGHRSGGGGSFNNAMPVPYSGFDMYGNPNTFQLPRGELIGGE